MVTVSLLDNLPWVRMYTFSRLFMTSKFLTSRAADALLFDTTITDGNLRGINRNIKESIPLQMPIFRGVDAKTLLKVREHERDAFLNYRSKITEMETEFRKKGKGFTKADALGIYEDIIHPELLRLKLRTRSIQRDLRAGAARKVAVAMTLAVAGLALGFLPQDVARVLEILGGCELIGSGANLIKSVGIPEEVKSDPFYFLWNVERYRKHARRH